MTYESDFDDSVVMMVEKEKFDKEHNKFINSLKKYRFVGDDVEWNV